MRRGRPSWYRVDDVGFAAINDGLILENQIFTLLRTHLAGEECYHRLLSFVFDLPLLGFGDSADDPLRVSASSGTGMCWSTKNLADGRLLSAVPALPALNELCLRLP